VGNGVVVNIQSSSLESSEGVDGRKRDGGGQRAGQGWGFFLVLGGENGPWLVYPLRFSGETLTG